MSALYIDNRLVHYEVFGRGQPVIFLHSWIGSWRYWVSTMDQVSAARNRTYALDFWGFGESDRFVQRVVLGTYVSMLIEFMQTMGIDKANVVGHGLGGMVALQAAKQYPDRFMRLCVVSTPIQGAIISALTKSGTLSRLLGKNNSTSIWSKLVRQIPIDDPEVQQELYEDTDDLNEQVVSSVQQAIISTDLRALLRELPNTIPLLGVYGEKDTIVSPDQALFINQQGTLPHQHVVVPGISHFPFLQDTMTFTRMLIDFLSNQGEPVEMKEYWRRRVSQRDYL